MTDGSNPYAPPPPSGDGPSNPSFNPYAPPSAQVGESVDDAESIRRQHLSHEASIKSFGCLYYWAGVLLGISAAVLGFMWFLGLITGEQSLETEGWSGILAVVYGLLAWLYIWLGQGLRALHEKVRLLVTIFAVLGLLAFPLGTLINLYFLYLLHGEKGRRIMTARYRQVVEQTPHIKYQTPLWVWLLLILLVVALIWLIVVASA